MGIDKLDEAIERFEGAMSQIEDRVAARLAADGRFGEIENEVESLRRERARLEHELGFLRSKAGALAESSKSAAGKIDAAMSRIRAVLHSGVAE
ncbi:DUF4164 family protein [Aestuariivirga sp.]|jgi:chromosome segregation ATPase|uniref:DUF4164 family protein n=1 Tax=Aestuariivirga sp. TaxID=2650926 RepID=UPI0037851035